MLREDLIECSKSGFNLPILIVRKKQGGIRICIDSRCLSKHIVKIRLPLPAINDLIRKLGSSKIFCIIDLKSAFGDTNTRPLNTGPGRKRRIKLLPE